MTISNPRLLLVDSYDSFTHNLAALCRQAIPNVSVTIIKNDDLTIQELRTYLPYFSCVVVGPGPGSPDIPEDIGLVRELWKLKELDLLPIFGVCLGLQSLAIENGGILKRLQTVKHGQISQIHHHSRDLFNNVGTVRAVRYHSLHVELKEDGEVERLAWADDEDNGEVVMAVRHKRKPFWAVQYHPESVCTEGGGLQVVRSFWILAQEWSKNNGRRVTPWKADVGDRIGHPWPYSSFPSRPTAPHTRREIITSSLNRCDLSVIDICEAFGVDDESSRFVLLDSAAKPGHFSVIGSLTPSTLQIKYRVGDQKVCLTEGGEATYEALGSHDIWAWLAEFMRLRSVISGNPEIPFWGGLIGYLSYELGVHSMHVPLKQPKSTASRNKHPDVNLVFVERSVVVDTRTGQTYVQSIALDDDHWVSQTKEMLEQLPSRQHTKENRILQQKLSITLPDKASYLSKIRQAQEHLFAGDSYELCLTAQTRISIYSLPPSKSTSTSWERYKRLRKKNPAPHSAYLRLHPSTLLSSSPERFLSFSRSPGSLCQLRPIKGTIRKAPHITRAIAEQALVGSAKEVAENLMIVDLIRHDLHGVVGEDVVVKQFCAVEEYETVWQLVSVIEGKLSGQGRSISGAEDQLGWRALKECLPPGSMTGAPKKRSVEILQHLEDQERGLYSGVFGYWCVGGGGDWSVTIRSCFKYEEGHECVPDNTTTSTEEWVVGAGGAITALSDPEAEWEEMVVKLQSVLNAFGAPRSEDT